MKFEDVAFVTSPKATRTHLGDTKLRSDKRSSSRNKSQERKVKEDLRIPILPPGTHSYQDRKSLVGQVGRNLIYVQIFREPVSAAHMCATTKSM